MDLNLSSLFSGCYRPAKPLAPRPNALISVWGKICRRKPGPKSDRPKWEKILGVEISMAAWATMKKREQRGATIDAECVLEVLRLRGEIANDR